MPQPQIIQRRNQGADLMQGAQMVMQGIGQHRQHEHQQRVLNIQQETAWTQQLLEQYNGDISELAREQPEVLGSLFSHVYDDEARGQEMVDAFARAPSTPAQELEHGVQALAANDLESFKAGLETAEAGAKGKAESLRVDTEGVRNITQREPTVAPTAEQQPTTTTQRVERDRRPADWGVTDSPQARRPPAPEEPGISSVVQDVTGGEIPSNIEALDELIERVNTEGHTRSDQAEGKKFYDYAEELAEYRGTLEEHQRAQQGRQQEFEEQQQQQFKGYSSIGEATDARRKYLAEAAQLRHQAERAREGTHERSRLTAAANEKQRHADRAREAYEEFAEHGTPERPTWEAAPDPPSRLVQRATPEERPQIEQMSYDQMAEADFSPASVTEFVTTRDTAAKERVRENPTVDGEDRSYIIDLIDGGELEPREARRHERDAARDERAVRREFRVNPDWEGTEGQRERLENRARLLNKMFTGTDRDPVDYMMSDQMFERERLLERHNLNEQQFRESMRQFNETFRMRAAQHGLDVARFEMDQELTAAQIKQMGMQMQAMQAEAAMHVPDTIKDRYEHHRSVMSSLVEQTISQAQRDGEDLQEALEELYLTDAYQASAKTVSSIGQGMFGMPERLAEVWTDPKWFGLVSPELGLTVDWGEEYVPQGEGGRGMSPEHREAIEKFVGGSDQILRGTP